jgi:MFS transporter, DHA2 family, multidrug resistance protein
MSGTAAQTAGIAAPTPAVDRRMLLVGLALATGMEFYTYDSMNLVVPDIIGTLGVSLDEGSWVLTTYSCALFLGVPVCIWLAGHVGYKRYLLATIALFVVASIGCALAPDFHILLGWRAVQGFAGAGLVVWWRAAIYILLARTERSAALMRVSTGLYLSSVAGLLCSGYLADVTSWRLIFVPNLLYAAGALWILRRHFPDLPPARNVRLVHTDIPGILLLAIAIVSLQVILSRGPTDGWFGASVLRDLAWLCSAALCAFLLWQVAPINRAPLLDLALVRDRRVLAAIVLGVFTGMILSGSLYALPEYLRNIDPRRLSAFQAGQVMCVYALTAAAIRPMMVEVVARIGQRVAILLALIALFLSMLSLAHVLTTSTADADYFPGLILYALCLAPLLPSVGSGTVAKLEQGSLLDGVSLYMTCRQLGASLGVALLTAFIDARETTHSSRLFDHLRTGTIGTESWLHHLTSIIVARGGTTHAMAGDMALKLLQETAATQAATLAYADAFLVMAAVACVTLVFLPIVPPTPPIKKLFG